MPALSTALPSFADIAKSLDPMQRIAPVVELLARNGAESILGYLGWRPANKLTAHQYTQRTALPTVVNRDYNQFVTPQTSKSSQLTEGMANGTTWTEVDAKLIKDLLGDPAAFRAREGVAHIEALHQWFETYFFYGNPALSSTEFTGMAARMPTLGGNCIGAGGTGGGCTSIYAVQFGDHFYGIHPKGTSGGIEHTDHGIQVVTSGTGRMTVYQSEYCWTAGVVCEDWRRVGRLANIKVSDLRAVTGTQALTADSNILKMMVRLQGLFPNGTGKGAFLANRTVRTAMQLMAQDKSQNVFGVQQATTQFGETFQQPTFLGWPVLLCDGITNNEATIV